MMSDSGSVNGRQYMILNVTTKGHNTDPSFNVNENVQGKHTIEFDSYCFNLGIEVIQVQW
eukprot:c15880_g1_i1 orf=423-602(-)